MRDPKLAHILVFSTFLTGVVGAESCFSTTVAYALGVSCEGRGEVVAGLSSNIYPVVQKRLSLLRAYIHTSRNPTPLLSSHSHSVIKGIKCLFIPPAVTLSCVINPNIMLQL